MIARCLYCGLFGELGRCQGCGAPNVPYERPPRPTGFITSGYFPNYGGYMGGGRTAIEITRHGDDTERFIAGIKREQDAAGKWHRVE